MTKNGRTKTAATSALHRAIQERQRGTSGAGALSPTSTFAEASELYLARIARKREDTTYVEYRARLDNYVLPALGALRLRECTVAQLDRYFDALSERYSAKLGRAIDLRLRYVYFGAGHHRRLSPCRAGEMTSDSPGLCAPDHLARRIHEGLVPPRGVHPAQRAEDR